MTKTCYRCKAAKSLTAFNKNRARRDGYNSMCRECQKAAYRENAPTIKQQARERAKNRAASYRRGWRAKAIDLYGGKCACCGEKERAFLVIDHINGGGSQARTISIYAEMRRAVLEPDHEKYQVLCANCNMAKERKEGCPHRVLEGVS